MASIVGANVMLRNMDGFQPLHDAAFNNEDSEIVQCLCTSTECDMNAVTNYSRTALSLACHSGNPDIVKFLLQRNADTNIADHCGQTPLFYAHRPSNPYANGNHERWEQNRLLCIELLLAYGANVNLLDNTGRSVGLYVLLQGTSAQLLRLLAEGANMQNDLRDGNMKYLVSDMKVLKNIISLVQYDIQYRKFASTFEISENLDKDTRHLLEYILRNTPSLMAQCRSVIQNYLNIKNINIGLRDKVNELPLPRAMQSYLLCDAL